MTARPEVNVDWSGLEVMSPDECWQHLHATPVGRIGFVDEGSPVVLPVNMAVDHSTIAFRTAAGSKLGAAVMQHPVCMEIDHWDSLSHTGWSVLAKGIAEHVLDDTAIDRLNQLPVLPWTSPGLRVEWVRILVHELSGRRVTGPGA